MNYDRFEQLYEKQETKGPVGKLIEHTKYVATTPNFWVVTLACWFCFVFTLILWTFGYGGWRAVGVFCWIWTVTVVLGCLIGLGVSYVRQTVYDQPSEQHALVLPVCFGVLMAVVLGSVFGLYIFDMYAIFPMFYDNARLYTNVVASESSAAVADAGKLVFNYATHVKTEKSVGYKRENGDMYCVAPIYDPVGQPRIEYWAAGTNCCSAKGDFQCDAAANKEAGGGIVVFDNEGIFAPSTYPFYQMAREKAEAEYFLQSVANPVYVRWVEQDNLDYLHRYYLQRATILLTILVVLFFFLFAIYSVAMWHPRSRIT